MRRISLTDLPQNVLMKILSRLPLNTLFSCKCVCRLFNDLTSPSAHFNALYTSPPVVVFIREYKDYVIRVPTRHIHLFEPEIDPPCLTKFPFHVPKFNDFVALLNSFNGLLYLAGSDSYGPDSIISNPLTNEYVHVPHCVERNVTMVRVLGFSALSNRYKVLRLLFSDFSEQQPQPWLVQIHEVGSGLWRDVGTGRLGLVGSACYLNGAAYMLWMSQGLVSIACFDYDKEDFGEEIELPDEMGLGYYKEHSKIGILGGCLCLIVKNHGKSFNWMCFDFWVIGKSGETWSREFVIDDPLMTNFCHPASLEPLQVLGSGEILMLGKGTTSRVTIPSARL